MQKNIGVVGYVNALPLVFGLLQKNPPNDFKLSFDNPRVCAEKLSKQEILLGLIPSIEFARTKQSLKIVPNLCISSKKYVKSVELFFNKDIQVVQKIAVDSSSRTSVALLKILCRELYEIEPEFIEHEPDLPKMLKVADAALLIGDKALYEHDRNLLRYDLAEDWASLTGLPFVFAFWAGISDLVTEEDVEILQQSKDFGVKNKSAIAKVCSKKNPNFTSDFYEDYFTENIFYELEEEEIKALNTFYELAFYHGLIQQIPDLDFFGYSDC